MHKTTSLIRPSTAADLTAVLAMNQQYVDLLSPLDTMRLNELLEMAAYDRVAVQDEIPVAFLLVFSPGAAYDSANYRWFEQRYENFLYVDRVVVSGAAQGGGLGRALYNDLITFARDNAVPRICLEYNCEPLNVTSQKFHARMGFKEVGRQKSNDGKKQVSMQSLHTT